MKDKSQILKYISKLAPCGIYTSGKGTSGAGLTASALKDESTGGWILEAGALVLGDKGNVCIDELDKMSRNDRDSIHEALEQQTVSIAKAGIVTTLNSRCSVLAAVNPKFGRFDEFKSIADQINLPSPILSRFDLIFVIRDIPDVQKDFEIAEHILDEYTSEDEIIQPKFLRKYIAYAKKNINPIFSKEAKEELKQAYTNIRRIVEFDEKATIPITARQLEAIMRLATANAKVRLSDTVTIDDARKTIKLQQYCIRQIDIDPSTGKIDIDRVEVEQLKLKKDKMNVIIEMITELSEEFDDTGVQLNILYEELENEYNISKKNS